MKKTFNKFTRDVRGTVASGFAVCSIVLVLVIGAAIDTSAMISERSELQNYSDLAVLAAVVSGETELSALQQVAQEAVSAHAGEGVTLTVEFVDGTHEILRVSVASDYEPLIMGAFKRKKSGISAISEAPLGGALKLNLAMVLDTTESMAGSRMSALKVASDDLLTSIDSTANGDDNVRVSLVPFSSYVRIDPALRNESWLNVQPDHDSSWNVLDESASTNCRLEGSGETERTVCENSVYETKTARISWVGCMGSRLDNYHTVPEYGVRKMQGPAGSIECNTNNSIMHPLTTDLGAVKANIQALATTGKTYIPSGLVWGWRTLERNLPFDEAKATPQADTRDVLLLMSDGSNTASLSEYNTDKDFDGLYHWGDGSDSEKTQSANSLTSELCTLIKADGIEIITIAFEITDPETITLMRNCASSPRNFYDAQSGDALKESFNRIGAGFNEVRLSR